MARDPKKLRKAYEFKLGKDRAGKLSDEQISLISKYYNSLSEEEQRKIDNSLFQGRSDNDLIEMADSFIAENEESAPDSDFVQEVNDKLDSNLRGVNEDILGKIDELIAGYEKKVKAGPQKTSTALAIYEGDKKKDEDLVSEEVDERILSLLGLEDAIDIDKGTYKTLLRDKLIESEMGKTTLTTEENELLANELKRVRRETGVFKVKKKMSASSFDEGSSVTTKPSVNVGRSLLPDLKNVEQNTEEVAEEGSKKRTKRRSEVAELKTFITKTLAPSLKSIEKNLASIVATMSKQVTLEEKQDEQERVAAEKAKKRTREGKMESGSGIGDMLMKPLKAVGEKAKGFLGMIWDFIKNVLIGGFLVGLMEILKDPKKWLNGIIDWINGIIDWLDKGLKKLVQPFVDATNVLIGSINNVANGLENTINEALKIVGMDPVDLYKDIKPVELPENLLPRFERFKTEEEKKEEGGQKTQGFSGGGMVTPTIDVGDISFSGGGTVLKSSGVNITGMGKDTQLIAAQPGEIVMSKDAVNFHGADNILNMNLQGGGTNVPKSGTIKGFQGGGKVGGGNSKSKGKGPNWIQQIHNNVSNFFGGGNKNKTPKKPPTGAAATMGSSRRTGGRITPTTTATPTIPSTPTSSPSASRRSRRRNRRSTSTTPMVPSPSRSTGGGGTSSSRRLNRRGRGSRASTRTRKPSGVSPQTPVMGGGKKGSSSHYGPGGARPKHDFGMNLAKMLAMYESGSHPGYTKAYLDTELIPTIGHGATYYPEGFRLKGKVQMGQTITPEEVLEIKEKHITEHRARLLKEIPAEVYHTLPDNVKAGLESMVFNYGSLRGADSGLAQMVIKANKEKNFAPVANLFRNKLSRHNRGVNAWRRNDEANLIEKGFSAREGFDRIYFETESTTAPTAPQTQAKLKPQSVAQISPSRVPSQLPNVPSPPRGQRGITIAAVPVMMGSGGPSSHTDSAQKRAPNFPTMDPNNADLMGVKSIYNVSDIG